MTQKEVIGQIKKNVFISLLMFDVHSLRELSDNLKDISIKATFHPDQITSEDTQLLGRIAARYEDVVWQINELK